MLLNPEDRGWTPRPLPAPLTATAGSRASSEVSAARVRDDLRRAAREEAARERIIERQAPIPLAPAASDDAEIEQQAAFIADRERLIARQRKQIEQQRALLGAGFRARLRRVLRRPPR